MQLKLITPLNATYIFSGFYGLHEEPEIVNGMSSHWFYNTDAALETIQQHSYQMDLIIVPSPQPGIQKRASNWDIQYVEPSRRLGI